MEAFDFNAENPFLGTFVKTGSKTASSVPQVETGTIQGKISFNPAALRLLDIKAKQDYVLMYDMLGKKNPMTGAEFTEAERYFIAKSPIIGLGSKVDATGGFSLAGTYNTMLAANGCFSATLQDLVDIKRGEYSSSKTGSFLANFKMVYSLTEYMEIPIVKDMPPVKLYALTFLREDVIDRTEKEEAEIATTDIPAQEEIAFDAMAD